ncbi:right-handed parallel beta-helix repeat-containing protein [Natrarchaeobius chitinivorans]|uniref:right-handed parallel beta-helix repeat-containing protein n=1 Tax=Natrarchaeobius chitinivorans TaxID=1679083 RepID=UPI001FB446F0|nr:right-handed parallel beta-helix repeat-containing protein [Natrarchaeobius chitinivorans]
MARDQPTLDDDNIAATDADSAEQDHNDTLLRRRSYLKWAGTAAGAAFATSASAAASSGGAVSNDPEVADLGQMSERRLSISEGEDLSAYVANASGGELLVVPEGTYEWNRTLSFSRRNWGIRGDGDVTIMVPGRRGHGTKNDYVLNTSGENVFFANLTFDSSGRPATGFRCIVNRRAEFRNITVASDGPRTWNQSQTNMFNVGAESSSGEVLLDGIVAYNNGNISQYNGGQSRIGIWCSRSGKLTVRNSVISGFPNNGIYTRMPGEMEIDNCVFANNNVSSIRLGGSNEVVTNCTFYLDVSRDDTTHAGGRGNANAGAITADNRGRASNGGYVRDCSFVVQNIPNSTGAIRFLDNNWIQVEDCQFLLDQRDVPGVGWNNHGSVHLRNLVFDTENGSGATVAARGGNYSTVEDVCASSDLSDGAINTSSRGCSFDWDQAHDYPNPSFENRDDGDSGNEDEEPRLGNTIVIDGNGSSERANYQFAVDGEIDHSEYHSEYGTGGEIDGGTVEGFVRGGADGFRFDGEVVALSVEEGPVVRVNGVEIDPDDIGDEEDDSGNEDDGLEHGLEIDGNGSSARTEYEFAVDGDVDHSEELSTYGIGGEIDGGVVEGFVRGGTDGFSFTGELTDLAIDGSAIVRLDGEEIDPDEFGDSEDDENEETEHGLEIDGNGSSARTEYEFAVDGEVDHSEELSTYGIGGDIDGGVVEGFVRGGTDGFSFTGELTDLAIDGSATVRLDGEEIDPDEFGDSEDDGESRLPNVLVIDGEGRSERSNYQFSVDGDVDHSEDFSEYGTGGEIDGGTVEGFVRGGADGFRFSGQLTSLEVEDGPSVRVNGTEVDPESLFE